MKKRKKLSGSEMNQKFKIAFTLLDGFVNSEEYYMALILAFSILEDRVTAAYVTMFELLGENVKNQIPNSIKQKTKSLFCGKVIEKTVYDLMCKMAKERNDFYHKYFLEQKDITKEMVKELIKLIRIIDLKQKSQKKQLKKLSI